jgi:Activator of Hsp90 ATPase homolog 1-like protein
MTRQKSFKRRVRARMDKTSERYTAARRQLLDKAAPVAAPGARRPYSDEVVRKNTGRSWDEWFALLDAWGAVERPHPEIARWLMHEQGVGGWWAQGVTVAYEQARGLRAPGQRRDGSWEVGATKTVAVPVDRLYAAFTDPELRERWLPGATVEVRTAKPGRSIRANWDDGSTRLTVGFTALGDAKSQVAVTHERIPDPEVADRLKAFWRERVGVLKRVLEA